MIRALLIEDDIDLASTVVDYLTLEDIDCDHASNGVAGLNLAKTNDYDVLLLDVNLPRMNGLAVCKSLREDGVDLPVLMLTAMDTIEDKVEGFNAGIWAMVGIMLGKAYNKEADKNDAAESSTAEATT